MENFTSQANPETQPENKPNVWKRAKRIGKIAALSVIGILNTESGIAKNISGEINKTVVVSEQHKIKNKKEEKTKTSFGTAGNADASYGLAGNVTSGSYGIAGNSPVESWDSAGNADISYGTAGNVTSGGYGDVAEFTPGSYVTSTNNKDLKPRIEELKKKPKSNISKKQAS